MLPDTHTFTSAGVHFGGVSLRYPEGGLAEGCAVAAAAELHRPGWSAFASGWSLLDPPGRSAHIAAALRCSPDRTPSTAWWMPLAVLAPAYGPGVLGMVSISGEWGGAVATGSWLVRPAQGRGLGTLIRRAALAWAFRVAGVPEVVSVARADNLASIAVSRRLGYRLADVRPANFGGQSVVQHTYRLPVAAWERSAHRMRPLFTGAPQLQPRIGG